MAMTELILKRAIRLALIPNRAKRFEVDLTAGRSDVSLGYAALGLKIVNKGTGEWSLKFLFSDSSTMTITSTELGNGELFNQLSYDDLLFSNTSQPAAQDPQFCVFWSE